MLTTFWNLGIEKNLTSYQNKLLFKLMIVIVIIIILDFSSATLKARRLWKIFIGYWEKRITNQKLSMWSRYHLSVKEKRCTFSDTQWFGKGGKSNLGEIDVQLQYNYRKCRSKYNY